DEPAATPVAPDRSLSLSYVPLAWPGPSYRCEARCHHLSGGKAVKQYCYVVVLSNGTECWTRVLAKGTEAIEERTWDEDNLNRLLQGGWQRGRETPMSNAGDYAYSLVLLEKD